MKQLNEMDKLTFSTKNGVTRVYGYGITLFGNNVIYTIIGRIVYSERFQSFQFYTSWRINSLGVLTMEQITNKIKGLKNGK